MKTWVFGVIVFGFAALLAFVVYDILFSKPKSMEGTITELIYIEGRAVSSYTPYQGRKVGDHPIIVSKDPQWIAIVEGENKELFQVHCTEEHFGGLKTGDMLKYKKYEGDVFHIRYFAHYEDH